MYSLISAPLRLRGENKLTMVIKRVSHYEELLGIKELQTSNLKSLLTETEIEKEGFVTAEYSIPFLERMNALQPSIIAKEGDRVVGYALVATKALYGSHDLLDDLFRQIDKQTFKGVSLQQTNYVVVGQLCVAKSHRGLGVVQKMYDFYRQELSDQYTYLITDVVDQNPRSVKAHLKAGFEIIGSLDYGGSRWHIVLWDWNGNFTEEALRRRE